MQEEIIVEINSPNNGKKIKRKKKKTRKVTKIKRKNKKVFKYFLILILVLIALILLASSEIFNIKEISVNGVDRLPSNEVISFSEIQKGENIFRVSLRKAKNKIENNPYVESVKLKRKLPGEVQINVEEREIKYLLQLAESYIYIDGQGYILEISKEKQSVPILAGVLTDLSNIKPGDRLEKDDLIKLNLVNKIDITAKNYEILEFITKIDITDTSYVILHMEEQEKIAYIGDASDLNTRMLWVKAIMQKNENNSGKIFVDMDLNNKKPYFRVEK